MQDAHEQGTLVLFQNLDPAYTSAEVEVVSILNHSDFVVFVAFVFLFSFFFPLPTFCFVLFFFILLPYEEYSFIFQDMVCNVFKETCRAKVVQWTAYSSPHSGIKVSYMQL